MIDFVHLSLGRFWLTLRGELMKKFTLENSRLPETPPTLKNINLPVKVNQATETAEEKCFLNAITTISFMDQITKQSLSHCGIFLRRSKKRRKNDLPRSAGNFGLFRRKRKRKKCYRKTNHGAEFYRILEIF